MKKIAIIGGGIAGLYAAWRLRQLGGGDFKITIYEAKEDVGGRIDTAPFAVHQQGSPELFHVRAEMGAMRYPHYHKMLKYLCGELGIIVTSDETVKLPAWSCPFDLRSLYHLRGETMSDDAFRRGETPYRVRPEEQGKTPAELLEYAIGRMLAKMIAQAANDQDADNKKVEKLQFLRDFRRSVEEHTNFR